MTAVAPIKVSTVFEDFSSRQRQVAAMLLSGMCNKDIARDLGLSVRTVEDHRAEILKRSGAVNLVTLLRMACGNPDFIA